MLSLADRRLDGVFSPALAALAAKGLRSTYARGTVLIQEGDEGDMLFILISGRVRVFSSGPRGEFTLGTYGPGEYVGEMSLDGSPRSASVITLERTECARVTRHSLRQHFVEFPEFAFEILTKVIRRARAATMSASTVALNDVYGRLAQLIDDMSVPGDGEQRVIEQKLSHQDLASHLGCSRQMVSRLLKDLERGGYVERRGNAYVIERRLPPRW